MSKSKTFEFDEEENPWQLGFYEDRHTIAGYTGGFGNGKTAALGIIGVTIARLYEGARVLCGRATRPKLEDSTKPEMLKWFPDDWVAKWPTDRHNNIVMQETGSTVEFRHVRQEGKGKGEQQSNLLSATYDCILVDQLDDPEFSYKDFEDLVGRLRGTARYLGDDPTMPKYGPQWFRFGANPTRNWLFRDLVGPYFTYEKSGLVTPKLLRDGDDVLIKIYNAPSKANQKHTGAQYVSRMRSVFRGTNAKRFVDASWDAYEGLVFPEYNETVHRVEHGALQKHIEQALLHDDLGIVEGYDYGQASASCHLFAFYDAVGNIFIVDGFYEAMLSIPRQVQRRREILQKWNVIPTEKPFADPDIFRNKNADKVKVSTNVATLFKEEELEFQRGNNDVDAGLQKCASYLAVDDLHRNPITGNYGAPRLFISSNLEWFHNEIVDYYWNKNILGQNVDKPSDRNDHAMNAWKYMLTKRPSVVGKLRQKKRLLNPVAFQWSEVDDSRKKIILPRHM